MCSVRTQTRATCQIALLASAWLAASLHGQSETFVEDDRTFFDSLDVEIVNLDVMVTNDAGEPVLGLEREDFTVFEDGRPVELTHFAAIAPGRAGQPASTADLTPADGRAEQRPADFGGSGLQLVIFVNQLDLTPQGRNRLLRELSAQIDGTLRSGDRAMVLAFDGRTRILQELTRDPADLTSSLEQAMRAAPPGAQSDAAFRDILRRLAAVDLNEEAMRSIGGDEQGLVFRARALLAEIRAYAEQQVAATRRSVAGLHDVIGWLGSIPGRKALLYVGDGLPLQPAAPLYEAWRNRFEFTAAGGLEELRNESANRTRSDVSDLVGPLADFAAAQRVAVYSLASDARGNVLGSAAGGRGSAGPPMRGAAMRWDPAGMDASTPRLAEETSGASFRGAPEALLRRLRSDFDVYYSVAYVPDRSRDTERHQVEVRLNDPELRLRYRREYRAADPVARLENLARSALVLGDLDNPLEVAVDFAPETTSGGRSDGPQDAAGAEPEGRVRAEPTRVAPVLVRIPMKNVTLLPRGDHHEGSLLVFVAARDERGRMSDVMQTTVPVRIPNRQLLATLNQVGGYRMDLRVRPSRQTIAVVVYDQTARTASAVRTVFAGASDAMNAADG